VLKNGESGIENRVATQPVAKVMRVLEACGIDPDTVEPEPIGSGGNHLVYRTLDEELVVKIPINQRLGTVRGAYEEGLNLNHYLSYFGEYAVPAQIIETDTCYCTTMRYVVGRVLTAGDILQADSLKFGDLSGIRFQLKDILVCNQRLMAELGRFIDLVGLYGLPYSLAGFWTDGNASRLTNVLVDGDGRLHIIDYDMLDLYPLTPLDKVKSVFAYQLNQQTLRRHFGLSFNSEGGL